MAPFSVLEVMGDKIERSRADPGAAQLSRVGSPHFLNSVFQPLGSMHWAPLSDSFVGNLDQNKYQKLGLLLYFHGEIQVPAAM